MARPSRLGSGERQPDRLRSVSDLSWRLLLIGAAVVGAGIAADKLRLVLIPMFVAALLVTVLSPPARYLERKGLRPLLATWVVFAFFLGGTTGATLLLVRPIVGQSNEMAPALSDALDDVAAWFVDGPMGLSLQTVADARASLGDQAADLARGSGVASAVAMGEVLAGTVLALALTFFGVKDARLLQHWASPPPRSHNDREHEPPAPPSPVPFVATSAAP